MGSHEFDTVSLTRRPLIPAAKINQTDVVKDVDMPESFALEQNYPNPFNPLTIIKYTVAGARDQGPGVSEVKLTVYDLLGKEVAVLVNERRVPGSYEVSFDGRGLASGVYYYRLTAGSFVQSRTMLLLK
jgi:hypothetical protein